MTKKAYGVLICRPRAVSVEEERLNGFTEDEIRLDGWYYNRALACRMFQYQTEQNPDASIHLVSVERTNEGVHEPSAVADGRKAKTEPVRNFLHHLLTAGPLSAQAVFERGAVKGFSRAQLHRAKKAIGAVSVKQRDGSLRSPWLWSLPG